MKKLSKKSVDFIKLFLKIDDMKYISLSKHDVRILYDFYNNALNEIKRLDNLLNESEMK